MDGQAEVSGFAGFREALENGLALAQTGRSPDVVEQRRRAAAASFVERPPVSTDAREILVTACHGIIAGRREEAADYVGVNRAAAPGDGASWLERLCFVTFGGWTALLFAGASDAGVSVVAELVALRASQEKYLAPYLEGVPHPRAALWELLALAEAGLALEAAATGACADTVEGILEKALQACLRADLFDLHGVIVRLSVAARIWRENMETSN